MSQLNLFLLPDVALVQSDAAHRCPQCGSQHFIFACVPGEPVTCAGCAPELSSVPRKQPGRVHDLAMEKSA